MRYDFAMNNRIFAMVAVGLVAGLGFAVSAQQKPVSSRTPITVYKTPT
jgi:nitrate reductase NapE component